ncbi:acyl-CoA carboxylase epsilon subunit [Streptomyces sp. NPDC091268]|uniref:acyl-CoA carboxylase epsilon subunit n=1 Tax=Streptomyces sp. NPDC091268 TaxID=3365979 RepID=UPI00380F5841
MLKDAPDVPIASLLRVERGRAEPEDLAAIAVVVACVTRRTTGDPAPVARTAPRRRRQPHPNAGCWAGCWACR